MNRKYRIGIITRCIAVVFQFFSCNSKQEFKGKIGMTCLVLTNPFFKLIANVMKLEAEKYGYKLIALSGNQDPATQCPIAGYFVLQDPDYRLVRLVYIHIFQLLIS
jgi:ABC-type sugar transport system substrate-binding protein